MKSNAFSKLSTAMTFFYNSERHLGKDWWFSTLHTCISSVCGAINNLSRAAWSFCLIHHPTSDWWWRSYMWVFNCSSIQRSGCPTRLAYELRLSFRPTGPCSPWKRELVSVRRKMKNPQHDNKYGGPDRGSKSLFCLRQTLI